MALTVGVSGASGSNMKGCAPKGHSFKSVSDEDVEKEESML